MPGILDIPDEAECYLWAILSDPSGLDQAEFCITDEATKNKEGKKDGCFRAWPFQWAWWRNDDARQIEQGSRSSGKSLSIRFRALAFPFIHAGQEMVITAPEGNHLDALTDNIETAYLNNRLPAEMLVRGRNGIKHRPFHMNFANGARIMGRIPQRDGRGVKGCCTAGTPILTDSGFVNVEDLKPGDMVMTHQGRWRPIQKIRQSVNDCYEVRGGGSFPLTVSCDHRFQGAADWAKTPGKQKRDFSGGLYFSDVEKLIEDHFYWATPTEFPHVDVEYPSSSRFEPECREFWWLVGLYLADGHLTNDKGVRWRVHWSSDPRNKARKSLMDALETLGLNPGVYPRKHSSADRIEVSCGEWARWLNEHFGKLAHGKTMPAFCFSMKEDFRRSLLEGYLAGDGCWNGQRRRWEVGSASKKLAVSVQMLAQSLGYRVSCSVIQPKTTHINGVKLKSDPLPSYRLQISEHGNSVVIDDRRLVNKVKSVVPVGQQVVYNPVVEEDHSYVSGSIVSHNIHPVWLELDEGQDYPEAGWLEIIETLKEGSDEARWRAHGVTRGVRDKFYEYTQPENGWTIHHYPAMYRPNWSDEERDRKIQLYGHRDSPDFRRNVYGLHGDASSPLFVLHRLMECVDDDRSSDYNVNEYYSRTIDEALIRERDGDVLGLMLDMPNHKLKYKNFWIGMDVGYTVAPSAIVVFAEEKTNKNAPTKLKVIARLTLKRVGHREQVAVILWLVDHFMPQAFAMDRTGLGLPLFQDVQEYVRNNPGTNHILNRIRGYNFSEKVPVEFDDTIKVDENDPKGYEAALIKRNVLEYSSDVLRGLVDSADLILPWDQDLIGEFRGQTWTYDKATLDMYGRKKTYSQGSFHSLDACRMAVLAWKQATMEEFLRTQDEDDIPPETVFLY